MEFCITWVILTMMSIQVTMSYNVTLSPEYITVDIGTDSVNFTCTIQLDTIEAISEHWIIWWKDDTRIAENDYVLINSAKYSIHGVSSAAMIYYTQSLQVHGIEETDHGIYTCTLVFTSYPVDGIVPYDSSSASLLIRNFIPQPICYISSESKTTLICISSPSDPPITLHWIDNEGAFLTSQHQMAYEQLSLLYKIPVESESSNQLFTCRATSTGSTDTEECVINHQVPMTMMGTDGITITHQPSVSETIYERSTKVSTKTTHNTSLSPTILKIKPDTIQPTFTERTSKSITVQEISLPHDKDTTSVLATQELFGTSGDDNTTTIIIVSVLAGVILMIVFIVMLLRKYLKKIKNEESHLKNCTSGTWVNTDTNTDGAPFTVEQNEMYVSVDKVKLNLNPVVHYEAESGDIYAGVLKSKKSMTDKSP